MTGTPVNSLTGSPTSPSTTRRLMPYVVSALLLAGTVALAVRTLSRANEYPDVLAPATLPLITNSTERLRRQHDVIGTFATGHEPGDRIMVIQANGSIRFHLVGPLETALATSDTYQVALRNGHTALVTPHSGTVEALDIDHLSYFDDVYERAK